MSEYNNPEVSVIIPTYGGSKSLNRAIDSVLKQNYENYNVIVVDDNNPDTRGRIETEKYMKKYIGNSKVIYIKHSHNKNGAAARNTGVSSSSAKYICLLDDDDIFLENRILRQVEYLESNPEFQACYCWRRQYGKEICGTEIGDLSKSLIDLTFTPTTSSIMISREIYNKLNGFDESYRRHQDYEFLLRFYQRYKIGVVKEVLLEIIGNDVNNQLYGRKLYDLKVYFFEHFAKYIDRINIKSPGYKKMVYAAHFSDACKELVRKGNVLLAIKLYYKYGIYGGVTFWKLFFESGIRGVKKFFRR
ncbi:glycosyltransferase family 2 protein [Clostridium perfringens]|uniref:glycosyltransferase family 2 protein n=1 Tax=Clostridium perfringens TaxID=1502 RepID=UPI00103D3BBD|nr:glycosyltransferase family A protein [Clostridium perfringens]MBO3378985.1 glycosyltransferase family 2 protein [Clostridium perfringens]MCX0362199.1 glycosyltransferase family 2 protein [Clostridium perfringens]MDK0639137.1 glycosyltransferase family A protein [Clostridium perfringens]MDK0784659.1 glycosyltransferase family A protein [Clostridium perfringens]MDK0846230.1 glycosyltransferase family A protein [Clostridium perfringens]